MGDLKRWITNTDINFTDIIGRCYKYPEGEWNNKINIFLKPGYCRDKVVEKIIKIHSWIKIAKWDTAWKMYIYIGKKSKHRYSMGMKGNK